jgi:hypothetical protein
MAIDITVDDVAPFAPTANAALVQALIDGTVARAARLAPCIKDDNLDEDSVAAAKDILVQVVARAVETGTGQVTTISAGSFSQSVDTTQRRTTRFRPDEIRELQQICGVTRGGAFTIALTYDSSDALTEDFSPAPTPPGVEPFQ